MNWQAIALTARLAAITTLLLLLVGVPLAYWIAFSRRRWRFLVEAAVAMPFVLPPTVLGFYLLLAMGSQSPLGRSWESVLGGTLAFSFSGLVIGSVFYSLPFAVQPIASSFAAVDRDLISASATLGAGKWRTFRRVILPLSVPGVITGAVLSFAHTVGEFGVVLMIGGNIPGVTRTVSIDIYDRVQAGDFAGANTTAVALLVFSFVVLCFVYAFSRRRLSPWPLN